MLNLPETFRQNILDTYHAEGAAWLERLPEMIRAFEERWSMRVLEPFLLSFSYCAPAVREDGQAVVFKLAVPSNDFTYQVQALRFFNGRGMPEVIDADIEQGALLMEQLRPGKMLASEITDDEEATRIAAQVMQTVWIPVADNHTFPTIAGWAEAFKEIRTRFADRTCPMPARTIDRTDALFRELLASDRPQFLLHGDLHHFNILSVDEENGLGWCAIDPFGVVGEREMDIGAFVRNPYLELPITPELERILQRRFDIFHEQLGFDRQRMIAWSSVYAAVSAWWTISGDGDGWQMDAALADYFASLLE